MRKKKRVMKQVNCLEEFVSRLCASVVSTVQGLSQINGMLN